MSHDKAALRRALRQERAVIQATETESETRKITAILLETIPKAAIVLGYKPLPGEPNVEPFLESHHNRGGQVLLPVIVPTQLHWALWAPADPLKRSAHAPVYEPSTPSRPISAFLEEEKAQVYALVPALAVAVSTGGRLGQGGGYYDHTFGPLSGFRRDDITFIGIVHASELLHQDLLVPESHDLQVHMVATEQGMQRFPASGI